MSTLRIPLDTTARTTLKRLGVSILILLLALPLNACALLIQGTRQTIPFDSQPQGAEVWIDGEFQGTTPLEVSLTRKDQHQVTLRYQGREQTLILTNSANLVLVGLDLVPIVAEGAYFLAASFGLATSEGGLADEPVLSPAQFSPDSDLGTAIAIVVLGAVLGPILVSGTAVAIDASTGAWFELHPAEVFVEFDE